MNAAELPVPGQHSSSPPSPPSPSLHFLIAPPTNNPNTTSSASSSGSFHPAPRPLHRRRTEAIISTRGLAPVVGYSEDWLDQNVVNESASYESTSLTGLIDFWTPLVHSDDQAREAARQTESQTAMPARLRSPTQPALPDYVDLTSHVASSPPALARRDAACPGEPSERESGANSSAKRRRTGQGDAEELDMANDGARVEETLRPTQQREAIESQQTDSETGPMRIGRRSCIICMEPYTNVTVTACGHVYCHECLVHALMAGEKTNERGVGNCPVCRKPLSRKTRALNVIPISFMKKSTFQGSRRGNVNDPR